MFENKKEIQIIEQSTLTGKPDIKRMTFVKSVDITGEPILIIEEKDKFMTIPLEALRGFIND